MGCSGDKEKLEDQMMLVKLKRMEIQMEKEKELKKLSEIEGKPVKRGIVPDYIDPVFAREKNLYEDDQYMLGDKKTDLVVNKKSSIKSKGSVKSKDTKSNKKKDKPKKKSGK